MIPLRTALRSSKSTNGPCRHCRPTFAIQRLSSSASPSPSPSLSLSRTRPISHYIRPQASRRGLHTGATLLKDKKWLNHADEEGEAKEPENEQDKEKEEPAAESSKTAAERAASKDSSVSVAAESSSGASSSSATGPGSGDSASTPPSSSSSDDSSPPPKTGREIAKPSIPETYPQVLALPITRRPLFPGFYKAVTITSPAVIKAIRELLAHGQPYIGAFLLKDSNSDSDVITSMDQVHPVGVFAQITSVFGSTEQQAGKEKEGGGTTEAKPETLTAVLYPHRRIRIDELITSPPPPSTDAPGSVPVADVVEQVHRQETREEGEGDVSSFEPEVPSVDAVKDKLEHEPKPGKSISNSMSRQWKMLTTWQRRQKIHDLFRRSDSSIPSYPPCLSPTSPTSSLSRTRKNLR